MSTKLGDIYDLEVDENGKVRVKKNEAKTLANLPVNTRIARKKSKKTRPAKRGEII